MQNTRTDIPDTRNLESYLELGRQARADALHEFLVSTWRRLSKNAKTRIDEPGLRPCLD